MSFILNHRIRKKKWRTVVEYPKAPPTQWDTDKNHIKSQIFNQYLNCIPEYKSQISLLSMQGILTESSCGGEMEARERYFDFQFWKMAGNGRKNIKNVNYIHRHNAFQCSTMFKIYICTWPNLHFISGHFLKRFVATVFVLKCFLTKHLLFLIFLLQFSQCSVTITSIF
jgi:hypothetical protein